MSLGSLHSVNGNQRWCLTHTTGILGKVHTSVKLVLPAWIAACALLNSPHTQNQSISGGHGHIHRHAYAPNASFDSEPETVDHSCMGLLDTHTHINYLSHYSVVNLKIEESSIAMEVRYYTAKKFI